MWRYEAEHHGHADALSVVYHTLQLFILHAPHLEHPPNWQLHTGRMLSAVVVFWAVIRGIMALGGAELKLAWTRLQGGHVIICGMGGLGRHLASEFRRGGDRVVVIESDAAAVKSAPAGLLVLKGNADSRQELKRAGIAGARQLIAVCEEVQTNIAVVSTAGELVHRNTSRNPLRRPLEAWLFVPDAQLRQLLKQDGLFPSAGPRMRINVRGLDLFSLAARQVLASQPLDFKPIDADSAAVVHLVIVGFGPMGQRIALQAAQSAHFANGRNPRVTVLEPDSSPRIHSFLDRYPRFHDLVDFTHSGFDENDADAAQHILNAATRGRDEISTVAICWDSLADTITGEAQLFRRLQEDDAVNVRLALSLQQLPGSEDLRVLLFQTRRGGFARLFSDRRPPDSTQTGIHVFGTIEQTCSLDVVMHEQSDVIARALHENWYSAQIDAGHKIGDKPALRPWDDLDEVYRESNRHAADHIPVKLRAIGGRIDALTSGSGRLTAIDDPEQVEMLAKMEHSRWCAELSLMGYSYAPGARDDTARTHPDLVPWDDLNKTSCEYDRSQVRAIPAALERAGLGVFSSRSPRDQRAPVGDGTRSSPRSNQMPVVIVPEEV